MLIQFEGGGVWSGGGACGLVVVRAAAGVAGGGVADGGQTHRRSRMVAGKMEELEQTAVVDPIPSVPILSYDKSSVVGFDDRGKTTTGKGRMVSAVCSACEED